MGRPRGELRLALRHALEAGPGTTRELAQRSGAGVSASMLTLDNMVTAGEVKKLEPTRRPGVRRPVPVYALSDTNRSEGTAGSALQRLLQAWGSC